MKKLNKEEKSIMKKKNYQTSISHLKNSIIILVMVKLSCFITLSNDIYISSLLENNYVILLDYIPYFNGVVDWRVHGNKLFHNNRYLFIYEQRENILGFKSNSFRYNPFLKGDEVISIDTCSTKIKVDKHRIYPQKKIIRLKYPSKEYCSLEYFNYYSDYWEYEYSNEKKNTITFFSPFLPYEYKGIIEFHDEYYVYYFYNHYEFPVKTLFFNNNGILMYSIKSRIENNDTFEPLVRSYKFEENRLYSFSYPNIREEDVTKRIEIKDIEKMIVNEKYSYGSDNTYFIFNNDNIISDYVWSGDTIASIKYSK
ncbi:MAG: hypothetical protein Kapaf2KO_17320 [Candidatus Kapaibacteriales bacterium]